MIFKLIAAVTLTGLCWGIVLIGLAPTIRAPLLHWSPRRLALFWSY